MKKKISYILLASILVFQLGACGVGDREITGTSNTEEIQDTGAADSALAAVPAEPDAPAQVPDAEPVYASCYENGYCSGNNSCDVNGVCQYGGVCSGAPCYQNETCPWDGGCIVDGSCQYGSGCYGLANQNTSGGRHHGGGHHGGRHHR